MSKNIFKNDKTVENVRKVWKKMFQKLKNVDLFVLNLKIYGPRRSMAHLLVSIKKYLKK